MDKRKMLLIKTTFKGHNFSYNEYLAYKLSKDIIILRNLMQSVVFSIRYTIQLPGIQEGRNPPVLVSFLVGYEY
jgi:3-deoxy-D-manno-octulosonic acid (KDO) 8-phosphate synthase